VKTTNVPTLCLLGFFQSIDPTTGHLFIHATSCNAWWKYYKLVKTDYSYSDPNRTVHLNHHPRHTRKYSAVRNGDTRYANRVLTLRRMSSFNAHDTNLPSPVFSVQPNSRQHNAAARHHEEKNYGSRSLARTQVSLKAHKTSCFDWLTESIDVTSRR
jgi:hypothetical protein